MSRRSLARAAVVAIAAATSIGVGGGIASAVPTTGSASLIPPGTAYSPPSLKNAAIDILMTTTRYDASAGRISSTITLRGAPVRLIEGGPLYVVDLNTGTYTPPGVRADLTASSVPPKTRGAIVGADGRETLIPMSAAYRGNTVTLTADDPRLRNLPVTHFEISAYRGLGGVATSFDIDRVSGPLR